MTWTINWTDRARRDLRRLDRQVSERVIRGVERFAQTEQGDVTRLEGIFPPEWRLRVGEWRVRFQYAAAVKRLHGRPSGGHPVLFDLDQLP